MFVVKKRRLNPFAQLALALVECKANQCVEGVAGRECHAKVRFGTGANGEKAAVVKERGCGETVHPRFLMPEAHESYHRPTAGCCPRSGRGLR